MVFRPAGATHCRDKREISHGGADRKSAPRAKFYVYLGNVSPLRGEKPIFGPLSKNNTGMATRRTAVITDKKSTEKISLQCPFEGGTRIDSNIL